MVFFDLKTTKQEWQAAYPDEPWTAWQPHSVRVLNSRDGFEDPFYVESVHFASHPCPPVPSAASGRHEYGDNARSQLLMGVIEGSDPDCVVGKEPDTRTFLSSNARCAPGKTPIVQGEEVLPSDFEPKCMMVLINAASRKELFDQFMSDGRNVNYELRVEVNFTVAPGAAPFLNATAVSCALSRVVEENHERDFELQSELSELVATRVSLNKETELLQWWRRQVQRLPAPQMFPLPPPPPLGPGSTPPPAPPKDPSFPAIIATIQDKVDAYQARVDELNEVVSGCVPSSTRTCGRPSAEAPNPWLGERGERCAGYATKETLEEFMCGFWDSNANLDAVEEDEYDELWESGPYCLGEDLQTRIRCAPTADRTARSGTYEINEWQRDDRAYCSSPFFRSRQANDSAFWSEQLCNAEMDARNRTCMLEQCSQCLYSCVIPWLQAAVGVVRCTFQRDNLGQQYCSYVSDAGQRINAMHGAIRTTGYPAVPERAFAEQFKICVDNKEGRLARDAISCRKQHRSSPVGRFVPGFDEKGAPAKRTGYVVTCERDVDCRARCPLHPLSGEHYFCQKKYMLYDYASTNDDGGIEFHQLDETHPGDPDAAAMAAAGDTGICVDLNYLVRLLATPSQPAQPLLTRRLPRAVPTNVPDQAAEPGGRCDRRLRGYVGIQLSLRHAGRPRWAGWFGRIHHKRPCIPTHPCDRHARSRWRLPQHAGDDLLESFGLCAAAFANCATSLPSPPTRATHMHAHPRRYEQMPISRAHEPRRHGRAAALHVVRHVQSNPFHCGASSLHPILVLFSAGATCRVLPTSSAP